MGRNQRRFVFSVSGLVEWLSWEATETHYILRHASGFQFLSVPKWALRVTPTEWALSGDVRWNASERLYAYSPAFAAFV